ncbi:hypothetical protein VNI00_009956 [Paramarasmius palmivorus]|uniref:Uncharacterized protein n=1 Tax=Paramarasmius palmivorus TaxID=297713 RepID=A0AAW0CN72_9AGAR
MPRPRPLANVQSSSSGNYSIYQSAGQLTPRTPHSRAGRAEEAYSEIELHGVEEDEEEDDPTGRHHQSVPLLRSSASDSFPATGYRGRGDDHDDENSKDSIGLNLRTIAARLPIAFGTMIAGLLLVLIVVSYQKPGTLEKYVGVSVPTPPASSKENSTLSVSNDTENINTTNSSPTTHHHHDALVISYGNYTKFPLLPTEYMSECEKIAGGFHHHGAYWEPHDGGVMDVVHADEGNEQSEICASTITYMLSGRVGLVADLALMAQAAALARERNRTFFVDDTYWNRGKWLDHFEDIRVTQPGPQPGCKAPPPEELVACPRVIHSGTAKYHFAHGFTEQYEDAYAHNLQRTKPIFDQAFESFKSTIRPSSQNTALIRGMREELGALLSPPNTNYISVHIRRGDSKPSSWNWKRLNISASPFFYVASDSPAALEQFDEEAGVTPTLSLNRSTAEGMKELASPDEYDQSDFNEIYTLEERVRQTRGVIVDLAVLSGLWSDEGEKIRPQAVICTIPSVICKLSAIGLGWEAAFGELEEMGFINKEHRRWVEIDEAGSIIPEWSRYMKPFKLKIVHCYPTEKVRALFKG